MVPVSFYIILYHCGGAIFSANRFRYGLDLAADFDSGFYFVHGINVDTVYAVFFQVTDLADRIVDTCFAHVLFVISVGGDEICQSLGNGDTVVPSCFAVVIGIIPAWMGIRMPIP